METGRHIKKSTYDQIVDNILAEAGMPKDGALSIKLYPGEIIISYYLKDDDGQYVIRGNTVCTYEVKLPVLTDTP